jgi:hypothetical protein
MPLYVPCAHGKHVVLLSAPTVAENVPAAQGKQVAELVAITTVE